MARALAVPAARASAHPLAGVGYAISFGALAPGWWRAALSEPITLRLALASVAVLGGIAIVILGKARKR